MGPDINVEDLFEEKPLLLIVYARARYLPSVFAAVDSQSLFIGHSSKALQGPFLPDYDVFMDGDSPATYGKMFGNSSTYADDKIMGGKAYKSGDGMDVLDAQERLRKFLVTCCKLTLNIKVMNVPDKLVSSIPRSTFRTSRDESEYACVADLANETPYISPKEVDLRRVRAIISARLSDAEDQFRKRREDPMYFADVTRGWIEHAPEKLLDGQGKKHLDLASPSKDTFMDRTIGCMVQSASEEIHEWKYAGQQLDEVMQFDYPGSSEEAIKHPEFQQAMQKLKMLVDIRLLKLSSHFAASPPLRGLFKRVNDPSWHIPTGPLLKPGSLDKTRTT